MSERAVVNIVDDDTDSRSSLIVLVESMGLIARSFASAEEFLSDFSDKPPCCLVTDVRMPGMSGTQLQERLNNLDIAIPIVVITAHADIKTAVKSLKHGAVTFLEKTDSPHEICEAISHAVRSSEKMGAVRSKRTDGQTSMTSLTDSERQVLALITKGQLNKQVAKALDISLRTVEDRRRRIMKKLDVESFADLMRLVIAAEDRPED